MPRCHTVKTRGKETCRACRKPLTRWYLPDPLPHFPLHACPPSGCSLLSQGTEGTGHCFLLVRRSCLSIAELRKGVAMHIGEHTRGPPPLLRRLVAAMLRLSPRAYCVPRQRHVQLPAEQCRYMHAWTQPMLGPRVLVHAGCLCNSSSRRLAHPYLAWCYLLVIPATNKSEKRT